MLPFPLGLGVLLGQALQLLLGGGQQPSEVLRLALRCDGLLGLRSALGLCLPQLLGGQGGAENTHHPHSARGAGAGCHPWVPTLLGTYLPRYPPC